MLECMQPTVESHIRFFSHAMPSLQKVGGTDQRQVGTKAGNCISSVRGPCLQSYDEDVSAAADDDHIDDNIDDDDDDVNDIGCPLE